jgi:hypothetical protein
MATKAALGKIKIVAIIGSLAALALVLSPTFSILQVPDSRSGANSLLQEEEIPVDTTVVEHVSDEDLATCGLVNDNIDEILGVVNSTVNDRKIASDKLLAEYCSRPVLIHEIASTDYQGLSLVAYACDASSGEIGTPAMQDSLSDYNQIYCESADQLIVNETNSFLETVDQVRTEYLPLFEGGFEDGESEEFMNDTSSFEEEIDESEQGSVVDGNESETYNFNATAARATLDEVEQSLEECLALADEGDYYAASKSFDIASKKFIALFSGEGEKA